MLRAGLRVGEVINLTRTDLLAPADANHPARLRVCGKGQKERVVLLTAEAYDCLVVWLHVRPAQSPPQIFLNDRGRPLSANGLEWLLRRYGEQIGLHLTPHQLRHSFARQMTEAGMPVTSLGKLLGHARLTTTQIYAAGADPELAQAYHAAMTHLAGRPPASPAPPAGLPLPPEAIPAPIRPTPPPLPDTDQWARHLPPGLRQASLNFVQRRGLSYAPKRRRLRALHDLGQLRRYWEWQLRQRPIADPTELHLTDLRSFQTARQAQGKAPATINNTVKDVLALLRELAEQGQAVDPSVFRLHPIPRPDSLPRHLTDQESQILEAYVLARHDRPARRLALENACFFVLAHTGLRARECVELQIQDLDLNSRRLTVRDGKGQRDRVVYLSAVASHALIGYWNGLPYRPTDRLWLRSTGRPITYQWLHARIVQLGQAAGVPDLTPHRLRHTLATRLLNVGMDITRIQKLLGHQEIDTTMIYARVLDATVEADYQRAMSQLDRQAHLVLEGPTLVSTWPTGPTSDIVHSMAAPQQALDNSV